MEVVKTWQFGVGCACQMLSTVKGCVLLDMKREFLGGQMDNCCMQISMGRLMRIFAWVLLQGMFDLIGV